MDYEELAKKFLQSIFLFHKSSRQKRILESMRGEIFVLQCVYQRAGELVPSEISSMMNISSARIAAALNSLEKKGLITRHIDLNDRRRIILNLTPAGKAMAERKERDMIEDTAALLHLLGERDAMEYIRITDRMVELISKPAK